MNKRPKGGRMKQVRRCMRNATVIGKKLGGEYMTVNLVYRELIKTVL